MGDFRAILLKPNTQSKKVNTTPFVCSNCGLSYPKSEYKILYDSKKLIYFLQYPNWDNKKTTYQVCHECFSKSVMQICEEYELPALPVKVKDGKTWITLQFFYGSDEEPIDPSDMGIF